jgi:hypothetical protein
LVAKPNYNICPNPPGTHPWIIHTNPADHLLWDVVFLLDHCAEHPLSSHSFPYLPPKEHFLPWSSERQALLQITDVPNTKGTCGLFTSKKFTTKYTQGPGWLPCHVLWSYPVSVHYLRGGNDYIVKSCWSFPICLVCIFPVLGSGH